MTALLLALACPDLSGRYFCEFSSGTPSYSPLVITQRLGAEGVIYHSHYTNVSPTGSEFEASEKGTTDEYGWISQCRGDRIFSVTLDGLRWAEIRIDSEGAYTQTYMDKVTQRCPHY